MTETVIDVMGDTGTVDSDVVEVPFRYLHPDTLRNVISEFVTRDWEEMGSTSYTLEQKIDQVMAQLKSGKARLMFDLESNSCNIIPVP